MSLLVILLYAWQIHVNTKKQQVLGDVYYGVQIAYSAIIGSQLSILALSVLLIIGINNVSIQVTKSTKSIETSDQLDRFKFAFLVRLG